MDPQHHRRPPRLSYPSQKDVFRFLSITKRKQLAQKCPAIRKWHRTCGFQLGEVCFRKSKKRSNKYCMEVDGLKWTFSKVDEEHQLITNSSGKTKIQRTAADQLIIRFIEFHLNRRHTRIRELSYRFVPITFDGFYPLKVADLFLLLSGEESYNPAIFEFFKNCKFKKLTVAPSLETLLEDLTSNNIEMDTLEIDVDKFGSLPSVRSSVQSCVFCESFPSHYKLRERLWDLSYFPIGFSYKAIVFDPERGVDFYWRQVAMSEEFVTSEKYTDGVMGYHKYVDDEHEMFFVGREYEFHPRLCRIYQFSAAIQEAGKALQYNEMRLDGKLRYWRIKRDSVVFELLTRFGIFLSSLLHIPLGTNLDDSIESLPNYNLVCRLFVVLRWCNAFHLPFLTVLSQIGLLFFTCVFFSFPNCFVTLLYVFSASLCFCVLNYAMFPWKTYPMRFQKAPTQLLCP